jgi:hypothetical protein
MPGLAVTTVSWVHLLSVAVVFGGVLFVHSYLRRGGTVNEGVHGAMRHLNLAAAILLVSGIAAAYFKITRLSAAGESVGHAAGVVLVKLLLLMALGAFLGIGAKQLRSGNSSQAGGTMRLLSLLVIAIAAFLGLTFRS